MSQTGPYPPIANILQEIEGNLGAGCTVGQLDEILKLLDDDTFLDAVKREIRLKHNGPPGMFEVANTIKRCMRIAERKRDKRETHGKLIQGTGLGGGSALIVGGIASLLNPVIGLFALIPVIGGLVVMGASAVGVSRVDDEKSGYKQIAERLSEIHKAIQTLETNP